jgi:hypothetical protein
MSYNPIVSRYPALLNHPYRPPLPFVSSRWSSRRLAVEPVETLPVVSRPFVPPWFRARLPFPSWLVLAPSLRIATEGLRERLALSSVEGSTAPRGGFEPELNTYFSGERASSEQGGRCSPDHRPFRRLLSPKQRYESSKPAIQGDRTPTTAGRVEPQLNGILRVGRGFEPDFDFVTLFRATLLPQIRRYTISPNACVRSIQSLQANKSFGFGEAGGGRIRVVPLAHCRKSALF